MTDDLDRRYKELMVKELEEKERKRVKKQKAEQAAGNGCLIILCLVVAAIIFISGGGDDPVEEPQTNAEVIIDKGASIHPRINNEEIIKSCVNLIRSSDYRCDSVSRIDLPDLNETVLVQCNGGRYKYRLYLPTAQVTRY